MAREDHIQDSEKADEAGSGVQAAACQEPPAPGPLAEEPHPSMPQGDIAQDEAHNLEELAPVRSGPAYSVFPTAKKRYIIAMITWATFISPMSANIYFPALNPLKADLHVSSSLINLTLTSFMIFQGLAPTFVGDLADMAGRRPAYIITFIIYIAANIGLALQNSYPALFLLRCLQSTGSSGAIALGYGVVADISTSSERGKYMGVVGAGITMGPAFAPVIGGLLAQFLGWRSIFWFLTIFTGCFLVPFALTVPETGRKVVGNGSIPAQGWNLTVLEWYRLRQEARAQGALTRSTTVESRRAAQAELARGRQLRWPNPLKTIRIVMEKDMAVILFYNALLYTAFYDVTASLPAVFQEIYGFNDLQVGLCYLPFGFGCGIASFTNGRMLDRNYKRIARQIGFAIDRKRGDDLRHFPIERARLELIWPLLVSGLACYIAYGWALDRNAPLAASLVLLFLIGLLVNGSFNILSTLVVDLHPQSPSTATAANNLCRCMMGAGGTAVLDLMLRSMGRGWCFTFVALVCAATSPLLLVSLKCGPRWREERSVRMDKLKEEEEKRKKAQEEADAIATPDEENEAETANVDDEKKE